MKRKKLLALHNDSSNGNVHGSLRRRIRLAESSGDVYKIGICQQLEHDALDQATRGLEDACKEKIW